MLDRLGRRHPAVIAIVLVTVAVTIATTGMTVAGFLARVWWVFDISTSFRPQAIGVLAVAVVVLLALRVWWVLPIALVSLALNVAQVAPVYTRHQPAAAAGSPTLTIAHINMQSNVADIPAMTRWLEGHPADIVVVLDTKPDVANAFYAGVGDYHLVYPRVSRIVPRSGDPTPKKDKKTKKNGQTTDTTGVGGDTSTSTSTSTTTTTVTGDDGSGGYPLFDPRGAELVVLSARDGVTAQIPDIRDLPESAIEIHTTLGDQAVSLLGLHTQSPTTSLNHDRRDRHLAGVTTWLQQASQPAIAFGDFNVTYYSPYFQQLLDRSGAHSSQLGFGIQASWPVQFRPAGIGIDQSVYTGGVTPISRQRGPSFGSEHRVLIVTYARAAG